MSSRDLLACSEGKADAIMKFNSSDGYFRRQEDLLHAIVLAAIVKGVELISKSPPQGDLLQPQLLHSPPLPAPHRLLPEGTGRGINPATATFEPAARQAPD
jgi:hypothetical protein